MDRTYYNLPLKIAVLERGGGRAVSCRVETELANQGTPRRFSDDALSRLITRGDTPHLDVQTAVAKVLGKPVDVLFPGHVMKLTRAQEVKLAGATSVLKSASGPRDELVTKIIECLEVLAADTGSSAEEKALFAEAIFKLKRYPVESFQKFIGGRG